MEEAVLLLSDLQLGVRSVSFNSQIAKERVATVADKVVKLTKKHRSAAKVDVLNILLLGDLIHQDYPWFADRDEVELITIDQFREVVDVALSKNLIDKVLPHFKHINIYSVPGNHGSLGNLASRRTNMDTMVAYNLQTLYRDNKKISWGITDEFYQIVVIQGKRFLLFHGDQIKSYTGGLPWYGLVNKLLRWYSTMQGAFDVAVHGHFHTINHWHIGSIAVFSNGSFFTDDLYSLRKVGYDATPMQWLFFVPDDKERPITAMYPVDFIP